MKTIIALILTTLSINAFADYATTDCYTDDYGTTHCSTSYN
jgi:hypothetical protein